jgi:AraC-like DNA-binding protein
MNTLTINSEATSQKLYLPDLHKHLLNADNYQHFIKGTLLCFCRRGTARMRINYTTYELRSNDILAILPTHLFHLEECSEDTLIEAIFYSDDYWLSISHSIDYTLLKHVEQHPHFTIPESGRSDVNTLLQMIHRHECHSEQNILNPQIELVVVRGLAYSLLMMLVSLIVKDSAPTPHLLTRKEVLTHDFFELLSQHYETERQVAFYASKLCVTPKHLSTMVKEVTRLPILEWINNVTILNIKHRLLTSTDTIQQISEDLNFQTPSTFVRYFRQHTGVTPSKFRSQPGR